MFYRNIEFKKKKKNFNNISYINNLINITNKYVQDNTFDYYNNIQQELRNNIDEFIEGNKYRRELKTLTFSNTSATNLLLFLETCITTDINIVSTQYSLEHIYPTKNRENLDEKERINYIGNMTLLEMKNSQNGHKGNASMGAKKYDIKKHEYSKSSSQLTRDVGNEYDNFEEQHILHRTKMLAKLLDIHTKY